MTLTEAQRRAMFRKLKDGKLRGKVYNPKKIKDYIDYRKKRVYAKSGRPTGRFISAKVKKG